MTCAYLKAEGILYRWACDQITTKAAKSACLKIGYEIDFRQADFGNGAIEALDKTQGLNGEYVNIYI